MKRIYHPYDKWEDYIFGMWRKISPNEERIYLPKAIEFTSDHIIYGKYMLLAIEMWPNGCEHNLSCVGMNRQAYIGHAAVCIAFGCPEYITRLAWHQLTQEQQDLANNQADIAIKTWEDNYAKDQNWNRCIDGRKAPDFMDVRHIREGIPFFQRREGQHCNASSSGGGSQKKEKKIRTTSNRLRRTVQVNYGTCETLF